jgi:precorrin-2/cobalt-factor-2 C20-methyltransferase
MTMRDPHAPAAPASGGGSDAPVAATVGTFFGIGLGPGDPELVTVKAVRLIRETPVIAYFAKKGRLGNARGIVDAWLQPGVEEVPLHYPMTTEVHFGEDAYVREVGAFYEEAAGRIAEILSGGRDVALVCEGDPMFYGSFMHLFIRLRERYPTAVVPGVTGMAGCWAAARAPITWGDDVLSVLPGTLPAADLTRRLSGCDAAVIMKLGSNFPKVRAALAETGLLERAIYVERGTMAGEKVIRLVDKTDDAAPYFSLILVPGEGRRP